MAEITVNCYQCGAYEPNGTVTITPRGNGYEITKSLPSFTQKTYMPTFNRKDLSVMISTGDDGRAARAAAAAAPKVRTEFPGFRLGGPLGEGAAAPLPTGGGPLSQFVGFLTEPLYPFKPLCFTKEDALNLYGFFAEQMEWSPDALKNGTAHPDLLAAQARHSSGHGGSRRRTRRRIRKARRV